MSRFQLRKSVHINLAKSTHSELRILLFKKGLSMQEVIEYFSVQLVDGDEYLNNLLNEIEYNKKKHHLSCYHISFIMYVNLM